MTQQAEPAYRLAPAHGARVAVVGGCGGIGRAVVAALRGAGCGVAVLDLARSIANHPVPDGVLAQSCDATDAEDVDAAFGRLGNEWGGLDGLVNLCGFAADKQPIAATVPAAWDEVTAGNLRAAYLVSKAAKPLLDRGTAASVVHMASGIAQLGTPGYGAYGAAKAGVITLAKTLALEWAPAIRVNAVAPAAVDTAFLRGGTGRGREDGPPERLDIEAYVQRIPLARMATPADVAGPILFLLGPASAYLTGQTVHINGGALLP